MALTLVMTAGIVGCQSSAQVFRGLEVDEDATMIVGMPPLTQNARYTCGPTCLVSLVHYYDKPFDTQAVEEKADVDFREDLSGEELKRAAQEAGLVAYSLVGAEEDLDHNLARGRPVIVMLSRIVTPAYGRLLTSPEGYLHWVIVLGRRESGAYIVQDPYAGRLEIEENAFNQWWTEAGRQIVLIVPSA